MNRGLILYIEDNEPQLKALKMALENRGFRVEIAKDMATARKLIEGLRDQIDVIVLDMRLEDPEFPQMTGADVAIEYFSPPREGSPEFLIHSAYSEVDYYKLALKLGVATYLQKSEYKQADLIRHVRALVIRRSLNLKRRAITDRIRQIVGSSRNRSEAILRFCRGELYPAFTDYLGVPIVFLFTEDDNTYCCSESVDLPESLDLYQTIQAMAFGEIKPGNPFVIDANKVPAPATPEEEAVLKKFDGAAFTPLAIDRDLRLSIGILTPDPNSQSLAEPPAQMASVLLRHLESTTINQFRTLLNEWSKHYIEKETKRRELMRITAKVCLYVGRQQPLILQKLGHSCPEVIADPYYEQLQNLVGDLQDLGSLLESLGKSEPSGVKGWPLVSLNEFIKSIWTNLETGRSNNSLSIEGDCAIAAQPQDLSIMISSILQWFGQRFSDSPDGIEPCVSIRCSRNQEGADLLFEDRSERLDPEIRKHLFDPFAETMPIPAHPEDSNGWSGLYLSLYIAKVLVEVRYHGILEDVSDTIASSSNQPEEARGHRFRMGFPDLPPDED